MCSYEMKNGATLAKHERKPDCFLDHNILGYPEEFSHEIAIVLQ